MKFKKLTNEELSSYVSSTLAGDEDFEKHIESESFSNIYITNINKVILKTKRVLSELEKSVIDATKEDFKSSYNKCNHCAASLAKISNELSMLPVKYENTLEKVELKIGNHIEYDIKFLYHGNITKIVLPELLPKKSKLDSQGKIEIVQNFDFTRACYLNAFRKEFESGNIRGYTKKVLLKFVHYYKNPKYMRDNDNLDPKIIIDIITMFFLIDDSPLWCANYNDAQVGEYDHTEITIIPFEDIKI